jgi:hypothetical protein
MKKIISMLLAITLMLGLSGCSILGNVWGNKKTLYSDYVTSLLDSRYIGKFDKYIELTGMSLSDAQAEYEADMKAEAASLLYYWSLEETDTAVDTILPVYKKLAKNASYEVLSAEYENGTYKITVAIYPYDLMEQLEITYELFGAERERARENGEFDEMSEEEFNAFYQEQGLEYLIQAIENSKTASTAIERTVTIIETVELVSVSDAELGDLYRIVLGIID